MRAYAHDLKVFFAVVGKEPAEVTSRDVLASSPPAAAAGGAENVVRISDGGAGLSASTIKRRLAAVSSFYGYLVAAATSRREPGAARVADAQEPPSRRARRVPLVRGVRRLPRILEPAEVEALMAALRTERDRAIVQAMLLGGLRRCEVLGLRLEDLRLGEWRVFVADGKGGHQRLVPVSQTFFATVARYLNAERPADASTDRVFVALKGPTRRGALSSEGLDEMLGQRAERGPVWRTGRVTSCATRASPGCARAAWRSRRCRPRPVTARSRRRGSTCTSAPTGSPMSTSERPRRSKPKPTVGAAR